MSAAVSKLSRSHTTRQSGSVSGSRNQWISKITNWECLAVFTTVFLPSLPVLACYQEFLHQLLGMLDTKNNLVHRSDLSKTPQEFRYKSGSMKLISSELYKFSAFCLQMIQKCQQNGGRKVPPSFFELMSISLRNPYTHSSPFSAPVDTYLPSGYEIVSFDGTTRVHQLLVNIQDRLDLSGAVADKLCLCGLYCRISDFCGTVTVSSTLKSRLIYLDPSWNVCDVISLYEKAISKSSPESCKSVDKVSIDLVFLVQAIARRAITDPKMENCISMNNLIAHQLHKSLCEGEINLIMKGTHFLQLAALMCRCDHFDYAEMQRRQEVSLATLVDQNFPKYCLNNWKSGDVETVMKLKLLLLERWTKVCQEEADKTLKNDFSRNGDIQNTISTEIQAESHGAISYSLFYWSLHPAGYCLKIYSCQALNLKDVRLFETVWIAPNNNEISLLRLCKFDKSSKKAATVSGLARFRMLPMRSIISFGVQRTGAFFIVSKTAKNKFEQEKGKKENRIEKLLFLINDLCVVNELCHVLNFYLDNLTFPSE